MEAIGQNCEEHQGVKRFGYVHAEGKKARYHLGFSRWRLGLRRSGQGVGIWRLFDGWWLPITQAQQDDWTTRAQQWLK